MFIFATRQLRAKHLARYSFANPSDRDAYRDDLNLLASLWDRYWSALPPSLRTALETAEPLSEQEGIQQLLQGMNLAGTQMRLYSVKLARQFLSEKEHITPPSMADPPGKRHTRNQR